MLKETGCLIQAREKRWARYQDICAGGPGLEEDTAQVAAASPFPCGLDGRVTWLQAPGPSPRPLGRASSPRASCLFRPPTTGVQMGRARRPPPGVGTSEGPGRGASAREPRQPGGRRWGRHCVAAARVPGSRASRSQALSFSSLGQPGCGSCLVITGIKRPGARAGRAALWSGGARSPGRGGARRGRRDGAAARTGARGRSAALTGAPPAARPVSRGPGVPARVARPNRREAPGRRRCCPGGEDSGPGPRGWWPGPRPAAELGPRAWGHAAGQTLRGNPTPSAPLGCFAGPQQSARGRGPIARGAASHCGCERPPCTCPPSRGAPSHLRPRLFPRPPGGAGAALSPETRWARGRPPLPPRPRRAACPWPPRPPDAPRFRRPAAARGLVPNPDPLWGEWRTGRGRGGRNPSSSRLPAK